jgi:thiol:disulfide interchange protein DsbD
LTQSAPAALTVFAALGVGFAAPLVIIAFSPAVMRRLPRPGAWMETFRKVLAFPMYVAAAWLVWVLAQQSGPEGLARALAAGVALAFAAWLLGVAQLSQREGRRARTPLAVATVSAVTCVLAMAGTSEAPSGTMAASPAPGAVAAEAYSPERLAEDRRAGKAVLVNFTAAWCVVCQVNERVAFASPDVAAAFRRTGAAYLVADWTRHDGVIAKALADEGRVGVPLYLVYDGHGGPPRVLPQLLTPAIVVGALDAAAGGQRLAALSSRR